MTDQISSYARCLKHLYRKRLVTYSRTYRNFLGVIMQVLRNDYPIEARLRNGTLITLHDRFEANFIADLNGLKEVEYDITNDIITISSLPYVTDKRTKVKLHGSVNNGEALIIFLDNTYHNLPVKGKTVIDVGANIGDSSIYFALRGADKVIGVEPFPKNYEIAKKNVELNNLSNKVIIFLAGCAAKSGSIILDPDYESSIASSLTHEHKKGTDVPLRTLENLLGENNIRAGDVILKMDCEGCEYDIILSSTDNVLRQFSHMQIEYHYGYKNLKARLEKSGFNVSVTRPIFQALTYQTNKKMYIGNIFASLN